MILLLKNNGPLKPLLIKFFDGETLHEMWIVALRVSCNPNSTQECPYPNYVST